MISRDVGTLSISQLYDFHKRAKAFTFLEKVTLVDSPLGQKIARMAKENLQLPPVYIQKYLDKRTGGLHFNVLKGSNIVYALTEVLQLDGYDDPTWHYEIDVQYIESSSYGKKDLKKAKRVLARLLSQLEEVRNEI